MRRNLAVFMLLVGTVLFGIATGFVYLDQRAMQIRSMQGNPPDHSDLSMFDENRKTLIARAMVIGPLGAGLMLAGAAMVLLELKWFRRE
jgi:hypothetical protein